MSRNKDKSGYSGYDSRNSHLFFIATPLISQKIQARMFRQNFHSDE